MASGDGLLSSGESSEGSNGEGSGLLGPSSSVSSTMYLPASRPRSPDEAALRTGFLVGFGCLYSGSCIRALNSADHIPRFFLTNPHFMDTSGTVLCVVGGLLFLADVVALVVKPELRPTFDRSGSLKASRLAGYLWLCGVLAMLISLPYLVWYFFDQSVMKPHSVAWLVAGVFTVLATAFTSRETIAHLRNYRIPLLQRNIIRIIWIVPVYSIACFIGMRFLQERVYIGTVRELYEAFVVYSFMKLMTDFMTQLAQKENTTVVALIASQPDAHHMFPVTLLAKAGWVDPAPKMALITADGSSSPFLNQTSVGVLQYVPVSIFCAVMSTVLELFGVFNEGIVSHGAFTHGWLYLVILRNVSQFWALYSLVLFYHGTSELLAPLRPFPKFLSIKLVIFATFWQKIILVALKRWDMMPLDSTWNQFYAEHNESGWGDNIETKEEFIELSSVGIQDLLICIEMFIAALAHRTVFSYSDFKRPDGTQEEPEGQLGRGTLHFSDALGDIFNVSKEWGEVVGLVKEETGAVTQKVVTKAIAIADATNYGTTADDGSEGQNGEQIGEEVCGEQPECADEAVGHAAEEGSM